MLVDEVNEIDFDDIVTTGKMIATKLTMHNCILGKIYVKNSDEY